MSTLAAHQQTQGTRATRRKQGTGATLVGTGTNAYDILLCSGSWSRSGALRIMLPVRKDNAPSALTLSLATIGISFPGSARRCDGYAVPHRRYDRPQSDTVMTIIMMGAATAL